MFVKWSWRPPRGPGKKSANSSNTFRQLMIILMIVQEVTLQVDSLQQETRLQAPENMHKATSRVQASFKSQKQVESDPLEACYLANNRASESLTISESTPIGSVVGELMVNGDSSLGGNIELSIKRPSQQRHQNANHNDLIAAPSSGGFSKRRLNSQHNDLMSETMQANANKQAAAASNNLNSLIDLIPPLTIERQSKRLILSKKLDRESLDKYQSSGYQPSSSSASLTVHVKCQLKRHNNNKQTNATGAGAEEDELNNNNNEDNSNNSILIPIHLIITDDNDNWPVFINSPYVIDLNESAQTGSLLPNNEIVALDNDQQGPLSTIEYSLLNGNYHSDSFMFLNPLDARSLVVKDSRLLDYESQSRLALKLMARDQGEPANWAVASLFINLLDIDDTSPQFTEDKYFGLIRHNKPGELVDVGPRRLVARDGDKSLQAPIVYSFHVKTNHSMHFELDSDLAKLSLRKSLPEHQLASGFCLLIRASQLDNRQRFSVTMVSFADSYANNATSDATRPKFTQSNLTIEVSEAAPVGSSLLNVRSTLMAPSSIMQSSGNFYFYLLDDELGAFQLDERGLQLTLNKSLDYEMYRSHSLRILVASEPIPAPSSAYNPKQADGDEPANDNLYSNLACDIARINVQVMDQNEFRPEFSHDQYNFQLPISDLIASIDHRVAPSAVNSNNFETLIKSEPELVVDDSLGFRAMLIGQLYCSDRDFNDKVSLQLTGNKAYLFHLAQDGRLYLPLINISHAQSMTTSTTTPASLVNEPDKPISWLSASSWFGAASSSFSSMARSAEIAASSPESPHRSARAPLASSPRQDHAYLNYLLGQFSNLGRLRLKAIATDDGRPKTLQASSLIVISLISIDNFIIQHHQQNYQLTQPANTSALSEHQQQVMMIQAKNGRDFVQVNSDILTNLISSKSAPQNNNKPSPPLDPDPIKPAESIQHSRRIAQPFSHDAQQQHQHPMQGGETNSKEPDNQQQRPSLLVVGDGGPKFVYLPSAIEKAVNQHVLLERELTANTNQRDKAKLEHQDVTQQQGGFPGGSWWKDAFFGVKGPNDATSPSAYLSLISNFLIQMSLLAALVLLATKVRQYRQRRRNLPSMSLEASIYHSGRHNTSDHNYLGNHSTGGGFKRRNWFNNLYSSLFDGAPRNSSSAGAGRHLATSSSDTIGGASSSNRNNTSAALYSDMYRQYKISSSSSQCPTSNNNSDSSELGSSFKFLAEHNGTVKSSNHFHMALASEAASISQSKMQQRQSTGSSCDISSVSSSSLSISTLDNNNIKNDTQCKGTDVQLAPPVGQDITQLQHELMSKVLPTTTPKTLARQRMSDEEQQQPSSFGNLRRTLDNNKQTKGLLNGGEIACSSPTRPLAGEDKLTKSSTFIGNQQQHYNNSTSSCSPKSQIVSKTPVDRSNIQQPRAPATIHKPSSMNSSSIGSASSSPASSVASSCLSNISLNINKSIGMATRRVNEAEATSVQGVVETFGFDSSSDLGSVDSSRSCANINSSSQQLQTTAESSELKSRRQSLVSPPQNPIHARLKQQASQQMHPKLASPGKIAPSSPNNTMKVTRNQLSRQELIGVSRPVAPPTPPIVTKATKQNQDDVRNMSKPNDNNQETSCKKSATKPVSPSTISVDRGYESYQSSSGGSSAHNQIKQQHLLKTPHPSKLANFIPAPPPPPPPSTASMSSGSVARRWPPANCEQKAAQAGTIARCSAPDPPPLPPKQQRHLSSENDKKGVDKSGQQVATGSSQIGTERHSRRQQNRQPNVDDTSDRPSANKQHSLAASRVRSNSKKRTTGDTTNMSMQDQPEYASQHNPRLAGSIRATITTGYDGETEDDDFHYGRSTGKQLSGNQENGKSRARPTKNVADMLLANYASHQYPIDSELAIKGHMEGKRQADMHMNQLERELRLMTRVAADEEHRQQQMALGAANQPGPTLVASGDLILDESYFEQQQQHQLTMNRKKKHHNHRSDIEGTHNYAAFDDATRQHHPTRLPKTRLTHCDLQPIANGVHGVGTSSAARRQPVAMVMMPAAAALAPGRPGHHHHHHHLVSNHHHQSHLLNKKQLTWYDQVNGMM